MFVKSGICLIVSIAIGIAVIVPVSIKCLYPAYHPINYTLTECFVVTSHQITFRCCDYNSCECISCRGLNCDALVSQPLNATSCCKSSTCCGLWAWQTCYREDCSTDSSGDETCEGETYLCNEYCVFWVATQQCSGRCGSCTTSNVLFYSPQFNHSQAIDTNCGLNDWNCATKQYNYIINSTWPCYYGQGQLYLEHPSPDPLVPMYWVFVSLASLFILIGLGWFCLDLGIYFCGLKRVHVHPVDL